MTTSRYRWLALTLAAMALLAGACSSDPKKDARQAGFNDNPTTIPGLATPPAYPVSVQRSDGKALNIAKAPAKIVSLSPGATETLYALGAQGALVAVDKNADYPDGAKNFPTKVDAYEPNIEAIAALQPDLVIVANDTGGIVAKLDQLNIPVLYTDIDKDVTTIDAVLGQIGLLGRITGTNDKAQAILADLGGRIQKVQSGVSGISTNAAPSVYHELDNTFFSASNNTFVGDIYRMLHMRNIAGDGGGVAYPQLTQEAIIAANPRMIVLADEEFGTSIDSVKARPGWSAIDAVKNSQIFAVDPDIISRPGPRIVDALEMLAKDAFPQRFP